MAEFIYHSLVAWFTACGLAAGVTAYCRELREASFGVVQWR